MEVEVIHVNIELFMKPCPSCEHEVIHSREVQKQDQMFYRVVCMGCGMQTGLHPTLQAAVDAWNTRPALIEQRYLVFHQWHPVVLERKGPKYFATIANLQNPEMVILTVAEIETHKTVLKKTYFKSDIEDPLACAMHDADFINGETA
jgi:hypothetical protein